MSLTTVLATQWNTHYGGPTDALSKAVGTGSNRYALALIGYTSTAGTPAGFSVGSDTLTLRGSVVTASPSGFKWALYSGALTQTGTQTCTSTFTGTFASGFSCTNLLILQGTGALTVANFTTVAEAFSGASGNSSVTVTSTSGDTVIQQMFDMNFGSGVYSAHSPATAITYDAGYAYASKATAAGASTTVQSDWSSSFDVIQVGYSVTEAGGGGGGKLFRTSIGGSLSGLGSSGPFFKNPL